MSAAASGGHEAHALLSPTQASTQVAQLLRRNSSRRRTRRTTSGGDPPSRSESIRRLHRRRPSTGSGPHSPHSPSTLNNPEIKIDTPKQSPVSAIKRPANLSGLKDCYSSDSPRVLTRTLTLGPHTSYNRARHRRRPMSSDNTDGGDSVHSDSSNPCSTTNLHDVFSDGSQDALSQSESRSGSRTALGPCKDKEPSVESRIAATDIRSIVRPKQIVLRSKVNGQVQKSNLQVPNSEEVPCRSMSASPEIIIEAMQPNTFANLSDDEKIERKMSGEIPKTDSEKRVEKEKSDLMQENCRSNNNGDIRFNAESNEMEIVKGCSELLGAVCLHPDESEGEIFKDTTFCESEIGASGGEHYASNDLIDATLNKTYTTEGCDSFDNLHEPRHFVADLYSKREKISLENDDTIVPDDICFADSSDHNSSQELLLLNKVRRRRLKESLSSDDLESLSAPILLSPRELGLHVSPNEINSKEPSKGKPVDPVLTVRHGSTPSVRFIMPSTPIRQMFQTPIARVESFHSDDFELYTSDIDGLVTCNTPSPSPNSIQTPTVPCFQYKLHSRKKKALLRDKPRNINKQAADGFHNNDSDLKTHSDRRTGYVGFI